MKNKILIFLSLVIFFLPNLALAINGNTYSIDFEKDSSQYAYIPDASSTGLDTLGNFSIEFWIKLESLSTDVDILQFQQTSNSLLSLRIKSATGKLESSYRDSSNNLTRNYTDNSIFSVDNVWHHIAVTCNISTKDFEIYLDGTSVNNTNDYSNASSIGNTGDKTIGTAGSKNQNFLDGKFDDFRIWSDIRTAQEISDNMSVQLSGTEENLVAYYKFNNSALDETSNNNDLTLANSPLYSEDFAFSTDEEEPEPTPTSTTSTVLYGEDTSVLVVIGLCILAILFLDFLRRLFMPFNNK